MSIFKPIITPEGGSGSGGLTVFPPVVFPILDPPPISGGGLAFDESVFALTAIDAADESANAISYPAAFESGDRAIFFAASAATDTVSAPSGYTEIGIAPAAFGFSNYTRLAVWTRVIDGTEGASVSVTKNGAIRDAAVGLMRVTGSTGISASVVEFNNGGTTGSSFNVDSINAGGGLDVLVGALSSSAGFDSPAGLFDEEAVGQKDVRVFSSAVESGETGTFNIQTDPGSSLSVVRFCIEG